jgi:hypothetical protein
LEKKALLLVRAKLKSQRKSLKFNYGGRINYNYLLDNDQLAALATIRLFHRSISGAGAMPSKETILRHGAKAFGNGWNARRRRSKINSSATPNIDRRKNLEKIK